MGRLPESDTSCMFKGMRLASGGKKGAPTQARLERFEGKIHFHSDLGTTLPFGL